MKPILTIAIPTYQNYQQLRWTLESMMRYTDFPFKIVVIDNDPLSAPNDMTEKVCASIPYKAMGIIRPGKNAGWTGALNLALAECDTDFFCSMNDDVCFIPGQHAFWRILLNHMNDETVGAVGPSSNFVAGGQSLFALDVPMVAETTLLIGFCKIIRTELLKRIGGYDEYLPGGDDLDTSIRILDAGYKLRIDKTAYLHHQGQQTGRRLFGDNWDSPDHQEATNNALVRKHGVKRWYRTFQARWNLCSYHAAQATDTETMWYEKCMSNYNGTSKGVNIGCGAVKLGNAIGIDAQVKDQPGAGGMKWRDTVQDVSGKAEDLPVRAESLDYIVAAHILEHTLDPIGTLKEWGRALKPDGTLYMSLPNHEVLPTILIDYTHLHAYTPDSFKRLLHMTGWDVLEMKTWDAGAFGVKARKVPC